MERWLELVDVLKNTPITERSTATAIVLMIERGRWSKAERPVVDALYDRLNELIQKWRIEDR